MRQHNQQQQYKETGKRSNNTTAIIHDPEHAGKKENGTNNLNWKQNVC